MSDLTDRFESDSSEPVRYPTNHVVAVLDTVEQVAALLSDLQANGFDDPDVRVHCGKDRAEALDASTGRRGLANLAIRFAEMVGLENVEMERKELYESAMSDGRFVVLVAAPTDERKDLATATLAKHRAHTVSFFGRFTIESIVAPKDATR